ncbi:MAG TPA: hypothetical protein VKR43_23405 [Bryobacteraceae bacterium]|nr:hypothetical protein [Bryobacteraceae bacterium]
MAVCLTLAQAQDERTYRSIGAIDVATHTPGEIVVRWRGVEYEIELADLPVGAPQNPRYVEGEVLGFYEPTATLFIGAADVALQNRVWRVLTYNLRTKRVTSIGRKLEGYDAAMVAVSPSGRYAVFKKLIRSGFMGSCSYEYIGVIDMRDRHSTLWFRPPNEGNAFFKNIRWTDDNHFEAQSQILHDSPCYTTALPPRSATEVVDVTKMDFR